MTQLDLKKLKTHRNYILLIIGIIAFLFFREWQHNRELTAEIGEKVHYKENASHYKNKLGQQVAFNKQLTFENQKQLRAYLGNNDTIREILRNFKQIQS